MGGLRFEKSCFEKHDFSKRRNPPNFLGVLRFEKSCLRAITSTLTKHSHYGIIPLSDLRSHSIYNIFLFLKFLFIRNNFITIHTLDLPAHHYPLLLLSFCVFPLTSNSILIFQKYNITSLKIQYQLFTNTISIL